MKRLVFLTARLPFPASSGRKNVMYNYCKILHETYGYDITVISYLEEGDDPNKKPDFINDVIVLPNVSAKKKIKNLMLKTFFQRKWPMQVSLFWDSINAVRIKEVLDEIKPDVVIADMVRMTEYAQEYQGYKIADLDDMLSIRYERQLSQDMASINPYGAYLYSLPKNVQKILSSSGMKTAILKSEVSLLKRYERNIAKSYNKTVFVADREAKILNNELNFDRAVAVPLGVDVEYYGEFFDKQEKNQHTIAFLGAMSVAHNEAGAIHFIRDIFPLIQERVSDAKFIVVGGGITDQLKKAAKGNNSVIFTGRVEDVRTEVGKCQVFVCPLTFGSGIKTKNLEAMAMGVSVVTTTIGAENINAIDGQDWLVADDDREFAQAVVDLMRDDSKRRDMEKNAFQFVEHCFTWKVAEKRLKECLPNGE